MMLERITQISSFVKPNANTRKDRRGRACPCPSSHPQRANYECGQGQALPLRSFRRIRLLSTNDMSSTYNAIEPIRVARIIDRLNIGGPAKHVTWLSAGLDKTRFTTTLITGTVPPGEGDMSYFARDAGLSPVVIPR
jgi:hypothetical protein